MYALEISNQKMVDQKKTFSLFIDWYVSLYGAEIQMNMFKSVEWKLSCMEI